MFLTPDGGAISRPPDSGVAHEVFAAKVLDRKPEADPWSEDILVKEEGWIRASNRWYQADGPPDKSIPLLDAHISGVVLKARARAAQGGNAGPPFHVSLKIGTDKVEFSVGDYLRADSLESLLMGQRTSEGAKKAWLKRKRRSVDAATQKKIMADVEASGIRGEKYEHVNVYNKAGERVAQFGDDNERKIEVSPERFKKLNGNAYVHNHPAGGPTSFSPGDLQVGKQADVSMMGAVTPRGTTFLLHRPKEGWPNYMGDDFNVAANKVATELINERKAGRISKADMNLVISDIANVAMAHANDLDYERNYGPEDQKLVDRYKHLYAQAESGSLLPTMPKALRTSEGAKKAWLSRKRGWDGEDIHDLGERTAKFYEGLTSEEKTGIFNYTAGAMEFNALLRTGQPKFGHDEEYIAQVKRDIPEIKKAIQKYELPEDTNAYRVFYGDMGKNLTAGQSWKDEGFVSTSASEALAKDFGGGSGTVAQLRIKAGTHAAPINGKSSHPGEQELLLDGGHTYTVTSMSDPDEQGIRYATIDVS